MKKLFTSESVSEGHPDKICDQISDAVLDYYLKHDPDSHVGCEVFVTTGQVLVGGEVKSKVTAPVESIVRNVIRRIGYDRAEYGFAADSVGILNTIHLQSPDIAQGVDAVEQGAGDQGMMFGYATSETPAFIPFPLYLSHLIVETLADIRKSPQSPMGYLRPDSKAQVTVETDEARRTVGINTVVVSTQHDVFAQTDKRMQRQISKDLRKYVFTKVLDRIPAGSCRDIAQQLLGGEYRLLVNPTGRFVIGGPCGDSGLTGRKIIVDTYGGYAPHGGGAFSGKDPSKVDRSAAYMSRHIAKNLVAAGIAEEVTIQLAYAIGVAQPVSVSVATKCNNTSLSDTEIAEHIMKMFDLSPKGITDYLQLKNPIYEETAAYGHFGRECSEVEKEIDGKAVRMRLFPWESTDILKDVMAHFAEYVK